MGSEGRGVSQTWVMCACSSLTREPGTPPILFIHGYSCDSHDWMWQLPHFAGSHIESSPSTCVGTVGQALPTRTSTLERLPSDLARLIGELGCGPVVAVGHSLGGVVASALAVEHGSLVQAVVSVDPGYLIPDEFNP